MLPGVSMTILRTAAESRRVLPPPFHLVEPGRPAPLYGNARATRSHTDTYTNERPGATSAPCGWGGNDFGGFRRIPGGRCFSDGHPASWGISRLPHAASCP